MRNDSTEDAASVGAGLTYRGGDEAPGAHGADQPRTMSGDDLNLRVQRLRQVSCDLS